MRSHYPEKFDKIEQQTLFHALDAASRDTIRAIAVDNQLTQQELRLLVESSLDLEMWEETSLSMFWDELRGASALSGPEFKKWALAKVRERMETLRRGETFYRQRGGSRISVHRLDKRVERRASPGRIFGLCPVQSDKTLCCNLLTVDAVKNCGFACSYCSIQTMYTDENIVFDSDFRAKLETIELDPGRRYHIGTGQSSDALAWGNKYGVLDDMLYFAEKWPNALVEFKTKSKNVDYLLRARPPGNVICSWSLNPEVIIDNEETLTATLSERLDSARAVADRDIRVGFHLHPMVRYHGWRADYTAMIEQVLARFRSEEVVFVSLGALTFPKPILKKLRSAGTKSKIHQSPMSTNPEGKLTYPDAIKEQLFEHAYEAFGPWHSKVFFYLCMEEARFWRTTFGKAYPDNDALEASLLAGAWKKLPV